MSMSSRVPDWLTPLAWCWIAVSLLSAALIAVRVLRGRGTGSPAADLVWVSTALYLGPFAVALHHRHGARAPGAADVNDPSPTLVAGLPGGAASALAHLVGVPLVVASGLTIAGIDLWPMILVIGVVAVLLLTAYARVAGREHGAVPSLGRALGLAAATVLAFDVGMGGWMLLLHYSSFMPAATTGAFWFLMQLGIVLGLATAVPLVRRLAGRPVSPEPRPA
ncbi:DUF4396 domain-containing protein [uncultured Nocardioides sp.]|uniref:DUF4396 domain-containing protein n=1 Tax=uncultured Nocardioides sp. TaxID=198441 RepID=UPI0026038BEB|nr:DUF4396 domain-containing protein [uncultured Nocardioides sp.]